jgi:hypothetical protein
MKKPILGNFVETVDHCSSKMKKEKRKREMNESNFDLNLENHSDQVDKPKKKKKIHHQDDSLDIQEMKRMKKEKQFRYPFKYSVK